MQALSYIKQHAVIFNRMDPWFSLSLFILASVLMIWRLGSMEQKGFEGTVLGTLIMPYASGFSNLMFALVLGNSGGSGTLVIENCLVNNVTNLTLLIGLPALFWMLNVFPLKTKKGKKRKTKAHRLNHLALILTLVALLFFTGVLWALARDGSICFADGLVLVGMFLFWQVFHVYDVLKNNVLRKRSLPQSLIFDFLLVMVAAFGVYISIERLVAWIPRTGPGFLVFDNLGWLSGLLMVLPNGLLAAYYAQTKRADIVYSSQIGDGHICIPLCVGLFSLFKPIDIPPYLNLSVSIILGAGMIHFIFISFWGRLPRSAGFFLAGSYGLFLYRGLIH